MSKYLKPCPVCGKNDWRPLDWLSALPDRAYCTGCGTIIPINHIDDRIIQWVPVAERLPEKTERGRNYLCRGLHIKDARITLERYITFMDGEFFGTDIVVTHWLDDHTFDGEEKS